MFPRPDLFSLPEGIHYLNCAYQSPLSKRVELAGLEGVRRKSNPAEVTPESFFIGPRTLRSKFAELIGLSESDQVAIMPSVSYGISTVAKNTKVSRGQTIVVLGDQFPSNVYPWRRLAQETGATIRTVARPDGITPGEDWNRELLEAVDSSTALVAVPNVHWTDGTRFDLRSVGEKAREVGAALVVDGTQNIGADSFELEEVRPDALFCAAYKWLGGPYAVTLGYYGPRYHDGVPLEEGWFARKGSEDFSRLVDYRDEYRGGAQRFDVGEVSNFALNPMVEQALAQVLDWGVENIAEYLDSLTAPVIADLEESGFGFTEKKWRSRHMFGMRLPAGADAEEIRGRLEQENVFVSFRGQAIRVAPYVYSDSGDLRAFREAVLEY
ncbi:MAG: aminotransferase class V-fold PLP-dependent enzyme [Gemmatimonadota bacterium]|nr:aminotransferase class V-fold PLP-dependent enzyme [Gemmatimonadota bacterium]